jgi:putative hydrolase of the HAD superfamily
MSAILLDALGTLVGFEDPAPHLRAALAAEHGVEVSEDEARVAVRAEIAAYRRLHGEAGDAESLAALRRACAEVLRDALPPAARGLEPGALVPAMVASFRFVPYPEVPGVLDALRRRGDRLAVVSNWDVSLHEVLERTGLAAAFDAVVVSAELGFAKPDPRPFARALDLLGVDAEHALHAGDQVDEDVAGAEAAGVRPVLVARDGTPPLAGVLTIASLDGLLELSF